MQKNVDIAVKKMVKSINSFVETKESNYMEEIEDAIGTLFDAQTVKFWKIDSKNDTLTSMLGEIDASISLRSSLTKQAIDSKSILLENHVTSNKYYHSEIDNPFALKIKALIIYPIVKGKCVLGVLKIWRGLQHRKVFSKKDEALLFSLSPLWLHLLEGKEVEKEISLAMLGDTVEKNTSKPKLNKEVSPQKKVTKALKNTNEVQRELEALKKERDALVEENQRYKENEKEQKNKLETYEQELETTKVKYKKLERSSIELYNESQSNQMMIKTLKDELTLLKKEHKGLRSKVKEKEKSAKSIKALKSEKSLLSLEKEKNTFDNIETCLAHVDNRFAENEYAYMLFEMMLYALNSKKGKGIASIEESIKKTKLIPQIMDAYYFKGDIEIYNEKCRISDLKEHTKSYEKDIFAKMININITVDEKMPTSLVFDAAKIQSIILHLLVDLFEFVDHIEPVNVHFYFKNKYLCIDIGGSIHKKNSLFQTMFKKAKLGGDEKDRRGLQLSKKLMSRLKGDITYLYENNYYKFVVSLPVQIIKM